MNDIFDNKILCGKCNVQMEPINIQKNGIYSYCYSSKDITRFFSWREWRDCRFQRSRIIPRGIAEITLKGHSHEIFCRIFPSGGSPRAISGPLILLLWIKKPECCFFSLTACCNAGARGCSSTPAPIQTVRWRYTCHLRWRDGTGFSGQKPW